MSVEAAYSATPMTQGFLSVIIIYPLLLFSLSFHEAAHAWTSNRFGDPTARMLGRITLNPLPHIDIYGTVVLPIIGIFFGGFIFGWGKPVPVDPRNLKRPREDHLWIALAGPVSNVILACVFAGVVRGIIALDMHDVFQGVDRESFMGTALGFIFLVCKSGVQFNLMLAIFNLIPVFPLDGSGVMRGLLPARWVDGYDQLAQYGMWFLLAIFIGAALKVSICIQALQVLTIPIRFLSNFLLPRGL